MLVLQHWRAPVQIPPRSQVPGLDRPGTSHVEENSEVVRKERPGDPVCEGHVRGQQSGARCPDIFEGHKGGRDSFVSSAEGELVGGGGERERRRGGRAGPALECTFSLSFLCLFPFVISSFGGIGGKERRGSYYDRFCWSAAKEKWICKKAHLRCFGSGSAAAMALRAACSGIANKR